MPRSRLELLQLLQDITISPPSATALAISATEDCAICRYRLLDSPFVAKHEICGHVFCAACLHEWGSVLTSGQSEGPRPVTCPMCRRVLMPTAADYVMQPPDRRRVLRELAPNTQGYTSRDMRYQIASTSNRPVGDSGSQLRRENIPDDPSLHYEVWRRMLTTEIMAVEDRMTTNTAHRPSSSQATVPRLALQSNSTLMSNRTRRSRRQHGHAHPRSPLSDYRPELASNEFSEAFTTPLHTPSTADNGNESAVQSTQTIDVEYDYRDYTEFPIAEWDDDDTEEYGQVAVEAEVEVAGVQLGSAASLRRFRRMMQREDIIGGEDDDEGEKRED